MKYCICRAERTHGGQTSHFKSLSLLVSVCMRACMYSRLHTNVDAFFSQFRADGKWLVIITLGSNWRPPSCDCVCQFMWEREDEWQRTHSEIKAMSNFIGRVTRFKTAWYTNLQMWVCCSSLPPWAISQTEQWTGALITSWSDGVVYWPLHRL